MKTNFKHIVVVGPRHGKNVIDSIHKEFQRTGLVEGKDYTIIGDGQKGMSRAAFERALDNSDETTHIHYWGHGTIQKELQEHSINLEGKPIFTGEWLRRYQQVPGTQQVYSCYSGAAKNTVLKLPEGQPVIFHSGKKYSTLMQMNSKQIAMQGTYHQQTLKFYGRLPNAYDAFEYSMLTSPETIIISEQQDGNVESFKGCATKQPVGKEGLKKYLEDQLNQFREFRKTTLGHSEDIFMPHQHILTDEVLDNYLGDALLMEINRKNSKHKVEYVKKYLEAGVNPNYLLNNTVTPLALAVENNAPDIVNLLLQHGANPNTPNAHGEPPLFLACRNGNEAIVDMLLKSGADINLTDNNKMSAVTAAFEHGHKAIVTKLLSQKGIHINQQDVTGCTLLYAASEDGDAPLVATLLAMGADINTGLYGTFTPLMDAAMHGKEDVVDLLLQHPNVTPEYLQHTANLKKAEEFCKQQGISVQEDNYELFGKSAAQLAREKGYHSIADKIETRAKELKTAIIEKYSGQKGSTPDQSKGGFFV